MSGVVGAQGDLHPCAAQGDDDRLDPEPAALDDTVLVLVGVGHPPGTTRIFGEWCASEPAAFRRVSGTQVPLDLVDGRAPPQWSVGATVNHVKVLCAPR